MIKFTITRLFFLFILLFSSIKTDAQFLPKDGAKLNYNQIYFEYPCNENAKFYTLYLAHDSSQVKTDFNTFSILTKKDKTPATLIKKLQFGKKYKWYVETLLKNGKTLKSDVYYFSLYNCPYADTTKYKFQQYYNQKGKYQEGIIWLDHMHCAIDRDLNVVWFLPPLIDDFKEEKQLRDFRIYNDGTITFIADADAYHINKNAEIIWKAPNLGKVSGEKKENYHHSFEKLDNGNYMILGNQFITLEKTDPNDTSSKQIEFTALIEYNKNKEIIWSWKMLDHFALDLLSQTETKSIYNTHCNSFSISENGDKILLGFRDISRIIEIEKLSGKILRSFGKKLNNTDTLIYETDLFRFPHDAKYISENKISVLNNNDSKNGAISSLDFYTLPKNKNQTLKRSFYFKFNFDKITTGISPKLGNALILPNKNILVNQGAVDRIVEINSKTQKPVWDVIIKKKYDNSGWNIFSVYRVNFVKSL